MAGQNIAVTYSPRTKKFYAGALETGVDFDKDQNYEPIARLNPERKMGDGRLEFIAHELVRRAERERAQGYSGNKPYTAAIDAPSISAITVVDLAQEVIGREWRDFNAIQACRRIPVPKLQLNLPVQTKYSASKKVPELEEAELKESQWATVALSLFKHVVEILASDEASMKGTIEPLMFDIDQASGALSEAWNQDIVTEVETFTAAAKGDWGALNTNNDFSARNPLDDIVAELKTIGNNNFRGNTVTMGLRVASDYLSNTFINGYAEAKNRLGPGVYSLPKFEAVNLVIDLGFTDTVATLFDQRAMIFGEGPLVAEQFRDTKRGANGYVVRQWGQPKKVTNNAGRKLTSVSA